MKRPLYLTSPNNDKIRDLISRHPKLGSLAIPATGQPPVLGAPYGADNGCFGSSYPGDEKWIKWVSTLPSEGCLFVTAPDVVGEAEATLARSLPLLEAIREHGLPASLVAQDGLEFLEVPWDAFDHLFIGGTTSWKLGPGARHLVREALALGKRVHMGRVNSYVRYSYAARLGVESVDGSHLVMAPNKNLPSLLSWISPTTRLK